MRMSERKKGLTRRQRREHKQFRNQRKNRKHQWMPSLKKA